MATSALPFRGDTSGLIIDAILNPAPLAPVRLNPDLPPKLEDTINRALEKDRDLRYQHASDMRAELQRVKRDTDSGTKAVSSPSGEELAQLAQVATRSSTGKQKTPSATKPVLREGSVVAKPEPPKPRWWKRKAAIAVAACVCVAGLLYPLIAPRIERFWRLYELQHLTIVPLTTLPGNVGSPTFSPDGSQVAFGWDGESNGQGNDLYVKVIGSEKPLRLTHH